MTNLTASLYFYPAARSALVTGGLGLANYHINSAPSFDGTGWGSPPARATTSGSAGRSLTPVVNYVYGAVGDVNQSGMGRFATGWKAERSSSSLGVTFTRPAANRPPPAGAFAILCHPSMLMLLVALGSQVPRRCPHAGGRGPRTPRAGAYRRGAIVQAATHFAVADSLCPGDHSTQLGLGFVLLRQSQPRSAASDSSERWRVTRATPRRGTGSASPARAWAACCWRPIAWRRTLRLAPGYEDAELQAPGPRIDSGLALRPVVRPVDPDCGGPTAGDGFEIRAGGGLAAVLREGYQSRRRTSRPLPLRVSYR